jgi:hypothetical protein
MTAEDRPRYEQDDITEEYSFDELAMGLADGTLTRGRALKLFSAAIFGLGFLGLFGGAAQAKGRRHGGRRRNKKRRGGGGSEGCDPGEAVCPGGDCCPSEAPICCSDGITCCSSSLPTCCPAGSASPCCPAGATCTPTGCQ